MYKMKFLFEVCVLVCMTMFVKCQQEVMFNSSLGEIKGIRRVLPVINMTVYEFRKIPYAKAPVGNMRFEKPQPYGSWIDTLDATNFGPSCYQTLGSEVLLVLQNKDVSEDCLHLNIYVPHSVTVGANKSVMVWIHGGGYSTGQAPLYDGAYLAATGNVIVVTINYRLNVFGFFATNNIKGNYGLWDQIMAIKWVKDNIESFGGNSQSITIFGESAGGFSTGLLSIIPSNRGLFQRAILQSGTAISVYTIGPMTRQASERLISLVNCTHSNRDLVVQCLKGLNAHDLYQIFSSTSFTSAVFTIAFAPVIDGELLTDDPMEVLNNKNSAGFSFYQSLDVVIGTVSGEGSSLLNGLSGGYEENFHFNISDHIPRRILCDIIAPEMASASFNNDTRIAGAICEKYGTATDLVTLSLSILDSFSDFTYHIPAVKSLRAHASNQQTNGRRYHYIFSRPSPVNLLGSYPAWFTRAEHASEIVFQFPAFEFSYPDFLLASFFMQYWTNFAKTGTMNVSGLPDWKEYDSENEHYINFDVPITTGQHLFKDRVNFWMTKIPSILQTSAGPGLHYIQHSSLMTIYFCLVVVQLSCNI